MSDKDAEIERLKALVAELVPFMLIDVKSGLALEGYAGEHHEDECDDCKWLAQSLDWEQRIRSGEFGDVSLDDIL